MRVNTSQANPDSAGGIDIGGKYHLAVDAARDLSGDERPRVEIDFLVLGGLEERRDAKGNVSLVPAESQLNRVRKSETFWLSEAAMPRLLHFACAVGLYSYAQWRYDREHGIDTEIDIEAAEARQLCARVTTKKGEGKHEGKIFAEVGGFRDFWALGDDQAKGIPLNQDAVAMFGGNLPLSERNNSTVVADTEAPATKQGSAPAVANQQQALPAAGQLVGAGAGGGAQNGKKEDWASIL